MIGKHESKVKYKNMLFIKTISRKVSTTVKSQSPFSERNNFNSATRTIINLALKLVTTAGYMQVTTRKKVAVLDNREDIFWLT